MRIPISWLTQFLESKIDLEEVIGTLGRIGIEVDAVESLKPPFKDVVAVKVLQVTPLGGESQLVTATIWDGSQEHVVVSADRSIRSEQHYAWARPGATVASAGAVVAVRYFEATASEGMLCSAADLGFEARSDGLLQLSNRDTPGMALAEVCADHVLTLGLTPNLGHCFSILGVARELSAALKVPLVDPLMGAAWPTIAAGKPPLVTSPQLCSAYHLVKCKLPQSCPPLPFLWQQRLWACGQRPISPLVDAANLVMLERGQPMHVFDATKLSGDISVRMGVRSEQLLTLSGIEADVAECLLIADGQAPQALAGLMGGSHSAVSADTAEILIEVANFSPPLVRQSAKLTGLRSESSIRFERGIDPQGLAAAFLRWAELLQLDQRCLLELQSYQQEHIPQQIAITPSEINRLLGTDVGQQEIVALLEGAFANVASPHADRLFVTPASWRNDLQEPVDIVEEVARLIGYDKLPRPQPRFSISSSGASIRYKNIECLRDLMVAAGLQEWITCSLISQEQAHTIGMPSQALLHYSSEEHSRLRPSLIPGMLSSLKQNQSRQWSAVASFEIGTTWTQHREQVQDLTESTRLAIICWGQQNVTSWQQQALPWDLYALKGIIESLWQSLNMPPVTFQASEHAWLHPGRQSQIYCDGITFGAMGELHPSSAAAQGLQSRVLIAELDLEPILSLLEQQQPAKLPQPPIFPGMARDLTLTLQRGTSLEVVDQAIKELSQAHLKGWQLMSIFDPPDKPDQFAATWRFWYRSDSQTLTSDIVDTEQAVLVQKIMSALASVEV